MCNIKPKSWLEILVHESVILVLGLQSLDFGPWVLVHAEINESKDKSVNQKFQEENNCGVRFGKLMPFVSLMHSY